MNRLLLSGLLSLTLIPGVSLAVDALWVNNGVIDTSVPPPLIDATTVINYGSFSVNTAVGGSVLLGSGALPFETFDTLNFINTGTMNGSPGFRFDFVPAGVGQRRSSASLFNDVNASIQGDNYLLVYATNIVNKGLFTVSALGLIDLEGDTVDLTQGVFDIGSVTAQGSSYAVDTNFFIPDTAVYDADWNTTNLDVNYTLDTSTIWRSGNVASVPSMPMLAVPWSSGAIPGFSIDTTNLLANCYSNGYDTVVVQLTNAMLNPAATITLVTNMAKGAIFVLAPPYLTVRTRFLPTPSGFDSFHVQLSLLLTNSVTSATETDYIYIEDNLANEPGRGVLENANTANAPPETYRPTNFYVDRLAHNAYFITVTNIFNGVTNITVPIGVAGFGKPETNFFLDTGNRLRIGLTNVDLDIVTNAVVNSGAYAYYSPFFDNVAARPPAVAGGTITNLPGSIHIVAKDLDLTHARLGAEGLISIRADNLVSSANTLIDCQNLNYDLGSDTGQFTLQSLVSGNVGGRLRGAVRIWSATWTNTVLLVISNNFEAVVVGNNTNAQQTPVTNYANVGYNVLIVDATGVSGLTNILAVDIYDLAMHGTQVVVNDAITVLEGLLVDAWGFTLNSSITIPGSFPVGNPVTNVRYPGAPLLNWISTNAPHLLFFTNNGTLSIPNEAHFGDDRAFPYQAFVNTDWIQANSINVASTYFENDYVMYSQNRPTIIQCDTGLLRTNGIIYSSGLLQLTANNLTLNNGPWLYAGDSLSLTVSNALSDGGPGAGNTFSAQNGVNLLAKPRTGDLMGTTIGSTTTSTTDKTIVHRWAGEDRGPTTAGFVNNGAVGQLVLSATNSQSTFRFSGIGTPGVTNALYVDLLDLTALGQRFLTPGSPGVKPGIQVDPNLILYYAAVHIHTNIFLPPSNLQTPEEYLDGQLGGHLRWVRTFAGPNSSTTVLVNGRLVQVNSALRNSQLIDSNGNGIPNALDPTPFSTNSFAPLNVQVTGSGTVVPNVAGQSLLVSNLYTLIAQPVSGSSFLGWTGDITSGSPNLTFVLPAGGLNLTANFQYIPAANTYSGLFYESNGVEFLRSGAIMLTTTKSGKYTGSLQVGSTRYSVTGQLNMTTGTDSRAVGPYQLQLQAGGDQITGTVSGTGWSADLVANRAAFNSRSNPATAYAAKYTILFPGSGVPADTQNPPGTGFGAVTVDQSGKVKFSGTLADGTKLSQTATLSQGGQWPLYLPLYSGNGQILSWQALGAGFNSGGLFSWIKQPVAKAKLYPNGFTNQNIALESVYDPTLTPVTTFTSAEVQLSGGNLAVPIVNQVLVTTNSQVINSQGPKLSLSLTTSQGLFKGSALNTNTGKTISFNGAILQNLGAGLGYFLGTNQSGIVSFGP